MFKLKYHTCSFKYSSDFIDGSKDLSKKKKNITIHIIKNPQNSRSKNLVII